MNCGFHLFFIPRMDLINFHTYPPCTVNEYHYKRGDAFLIRLEIKAVGFGEKMLLEFKISQVSLKT